MLAFSTALATSDYTV